VILKFSTLSAAEGHKHTEGSAATVNKRMHLCRLLMFKGRSESHVVGKLKDVLCVAEHAGAGGREIQIRCVL
jgi:hypothetical protein